MQENQLTLLQLNSEIKNVLKVHTERFYWIVGEISELKVNYSGHCYLELIQKDETSDQILARSRAMIWAQNFRLIKPYFETTTGQLLTEGLRVLVKVSVEFHEVYGLSLNITDIEPKYTVGEMALRKQKIIDRLTEEGVIDMNRELELPMLCRKIAIISSPTAAGYGDFCNQLENNPYDYKFYLKLFPAVMQGEAAEQSVIDALDRIYAREGFFDVVVIIRGGGSQVDLNCFNSYWLAYHITQFPLPVLTGIGHEQDDTVTDRVAHTRLKTPTAVAAYLIDMMAVLENRLDEWTEQLGEMIRDMVVEESLKLNRLSHKLQQVLQDRISRHRNRLNNASFQLHKGSMDRISLSLRSLDRIGSKVLTRSSALPRDRMQDLKWIQNRMKQTVSLRKDGLKQKLQFIEEKLDAYDPARVLERGYSITLKDGMPVKDANVLKPNDIITTLFRKGKAESIIKKEDHERE
ncbi:MAG: exodeoxyribonuclease VII large subunit [Bacteroidales bacterium]|nr:exodeoxyribonuclease VII large subunit [Bacteroidales bacterium]